MSETYAEGHVYEQDGLKTAHNHEFMDDPVFQAAYARGVKAVGMDYGWHWRVYVGIWAARNCLSVPGDFVECGVAKGFLSSSIMSALDWDSTGRMFYLLDTFRGLDERYVSKEELAEGAKEKNQTLIDMGLYATAPDKVIENFSQWKNVKVIVGAVPETLHVIQSDSIAYLHLDMNCVPPEIAAVDYLWDRLSGGALVVLDDYAYRGYRRQKVAMDAFAASKGVAVLSIPTGQGLMIKPRSPSS